MRQVNITIPGRPSRWQRPGQGLDPRTGRPMRFTDPEAEAGKQAIAWAARKAWGSARPLTGPCLVRVIAIFAIPKSWPPALQKAAREARVMHVADPDLDQLVKQVKDGLKHIAYVDDNQVVGYPNSAKRYGYPERTEITIVALAQAPDEVTPGQRNLEKRIKNEGWDAVLAPPKKKQQEDRPVDDQQRARVARKPRAPKRPPALQRAIDKALDREGSTRPASRGLFGDDQ